MLGGAAPQAEVTVVPHVEQDTLVVSVVHQEILESPISLVSKSVRGAG